MANLSHHEYITGRARIEASDPTSRRTNAKKGSKDRKLPRYVLVTVKGYNMSNLLSVKLSCYNVIQLRRKNLSK